MRVTKFFFTVSAMLLLVFFVSGAYVLMKADGGGFVRLQARGDDSAGRYLLEPWFMRAESSANKEMPLNLLVMGLDRDETRCDVIMLFNFKPDESELNILSIARDTRVRENGRYGRINALYSAGGERAVSEKITEITGLPVHYYITMDFRGFREIIDALGGVRFEVPFRMSYDDPTQNLHIHLKKGMQLLDGKKAEQLVRYRKGNIKGQGYTEGDIGRIKVQQDFLKELIKQKLNYKYISRADELFDILCKYVKTNIVPADIAKYYGSIGKINLEKLKTFTLPGESRLIDDAWYYIYDVEKTREMIDGNFFR